MTELETPRLRLRRFAPTDLPEMVEHRRDPLVPRWQSWDPTRVAGTPPRRWGTLRR